MAQTRWTAEYVSQSALSKLSNKLSCEHLVAACADFSQELIERCSHLTIIATTREHLRVASEAQCLVSSLAAPNAVDLFKARARLAVPNFKVVASNREPCGGLVHQSPRSQNRVPLWGLTARCAPSRRRQSGPRDLKNSASMISASTAATADRTTVRPVV